MGSPGDLSRADEYIQTREATHLYSMESYGLLLACSAWLMEGPVALAVLDGGDWVLVGDESESDGLGLGCALGCALGCVVGCALGFAVGCAPCCPFGWALG